MREREGEGERSKAVVISAASFDHIECNHYSTIGVRIPHIMWFMRFSLFVVIGYFFKKSGFQVLSLVNDRCILLRSGLPSRRLRIPWQLFTDRVLPNKDVFLSAP